MDWLLGRLRRVGLERWADGGPSAWLALSVVIWLLRRARRSPQGATTSLDLKAGERYVITVRDPTAMPQTPADT